MGVMGFLEGLNDFLASASKSAERDFERNIGKYVAKDPAKALEMAEQFDKMREAREKWEAHKRSR